MQLRHLSPSVIFDIKKVKPLKADFALSLDHRNLTSFIGKIEQKKKIITFAGLHFYQARHNGMDFLFANGGVYAPDTAIATEIFSYLGARAIIRIGSCGALAPELEIGDAVLADEILDYTGVSRFYQGEVSPSKKFNGYVYSSLKGLNLRRGKICSYEALFQETALIVSQMVAQGAIAVDMALAAFFKVASFCQMQAASVLVVSDHVINNEMGFTDKRFFDSLKKIFDQYPKLIKYAKKI
jgi:purine-nucleoside phosphorylase